MNWHNISIRQFITHNSSSVLLSLGFVQKEEHRAGICRDSSRHTIGASRVPAVKFRQDRTQFIAGYFQRPFAIIYLPWDYMCHMDGSAGFAHPRRGESGSGQDCLWNEASPQKYGFGALLDRRRCICHSFCGLFFFRFPLLRGAEIKEEHDLIFYCHNTSHGFINPAGIPAPYLVNL